MPPEDTLESVLAEIAAISQERAKLDERHISATARLEAVVIDNIRKRLHAAGEGLLVLAVGTTEAPAANPSYRAMDWFIAAADKSHQFSSKTGAYLKSYHSLH